MAVSRAELENLVRHDAAEQLKQALAHEDNKARINEFLSFGETLLMYAVRGQKLKCARVLVEAKADVNVTWGYHDPPVAMCATRGDVHMGELLLEHGAVLRTKMVSEPIWRYSPVFEYRDQLARCRVAQRAVLYVVGKRKKWLRDLAPMIAAYVWATRSDPGWRSPHWWRPKRIAQ